MLSGTGDTTGSNITWANQTTIHPVGLAAILILGIGLLSLPRRHALAPMLVMACFVSSAQRLVVAGLDFDMLRIMVLFGWTRILLRREGTGFRLHRIDSAILSLAAVSIVAYVIQRRGGYASVVFILGTSFNTIGMYFLFRCLIHTWEDVESVMRTAAALSVPVAVMFVVEKATGRNPFAFFGGVPEITPIREGKLRAQGAFPHAIIAGVFWASLLPPIGVLCLRAGRDRLLGVVGVIASLTIIVSCASSTPLAAAAAGFIGALLYPARFYMRWVRWAVAAILLGLHIAMNAPVWHLISRVDLVGGSTGWQRYHLIDQAITHIADWWLVGTVSTATWGHQLQDVTNMYVLEGARGGLLRLALFVWSIVLAFGALGRLRRTCEHRRFRSAETWAIGCSIFAHAMAFIAVSYFGQITLLWYLTLAAVGSLSACTSTSMASTPVTGRRVAVTPAMGILHSPSACRSR